VGLLTTAALVTADIDGASIPRLLTQLNSVLLWRVRSLKIRVIPILGTNADGTIGVFAFTPGLVLPPNVATLIDYGGKVAPLTKAFWSNAAFASDTWIATNGVGARFTHFGTTDADNVNSCTVEYDLVIQTKGSR